MVTTRLYRASILLGVPMTMIPVLGKGAVIPPTKAFPRLPALKDRPKSLVTLLVSMRPSTKGWATTLP